MLALMNYFAPLEVVSACGIQKLWFLLRGKQGSVSPVNLHVDEEKETGTMALKFTLKTVFPRDTISLHSYCKSTTQLSLLAHFSCIAIVAFSITTHIDYNLVSSFISVSFAVFSLHSSSFTLLNYIHNPLFIIFVETPQQRQNIFIIFQ